MRQDLSWPKAIQQVLASSKVPLHYNEITEQIISGGLRKIVGATPSATVNAQISASIKHEGESSPYLRAGKGVFLLRTNLHNTGCIEQSKVEEENSEEQYEIVTAFGMFWRKDAIEWSPSPKLLGMQQIGSSPVDFCKQLGIYLLYDGREVIYVGRSSDRPLGRRLYEHTVDRMSSRWDRFSWFGLLPVSEDGQLRQMPKGYQSHTLIPALEAILIEALEPRQNRRRGDDLAAV